MILLTIFEKWAAVEVISLRIACNKKLTKKLWKHFIEYLFPKFFGSTFAA